ncbi:F0F1 ATP synthase subunit gamma [Mycoplasmopsis agalactiae]|nr:ATP synthase F1 subunit gamma [Mycoplasmopsis agalactiae]MCE6090662.1 F0F1 ATP synthase subunit gamma [Mycoplasmopsis agalactiae]
MSSIQSIQSRIKTVQSIRKITHAMELVSYSKLKKAKTAFDEVEKYNLLIDQTFNKIFKNISHDDLKELMKSRNNSKSKLYIIVTSNLGLAGAYNANVIKLVKETVTSDDYLIVIGSYGIRALRQQYNEQIINLSDITMSKRTSTLVSKIIKRSFKYYRNGTVSSINFIYTKFINNLVQEELCEKVFPFNEEMIREHIDRKEIDYKLEFEPSAKDVLADAIPLFVDSKLHLAMATSLISEHSARRSAMENATRNSDSLITELDMEFKRKRQAKITNEIIEIVSGADAV